MLAAPFGVYLHIPFCAHRCDYCAFATWTDRAHLTDRYLAACGLEIERAVEAGMPEATTVFVGGGTPSLVAGPLLVRVLDAIPRSPGAEVTIECNPDTVTPGLLDAYAAGGVNRLSFGVQSMVPSTLAALGRTHDPANVRRCVALARAAGIPTFNLDLIYGGAGETLPDWRRTLEEALALEPPHVSAYALTVEAGTPLALDPPRHPDDDLQADEYLLATELLPAAGLEWYEISNWARPGHECRHNLLYWQQEDYLGFGCAAHSHRAGRRFWNVRTPERYLELIEAGRPAEGGSETLDAAQRAEEALVLQVRTRAGVPASTLPLEQLSELVDVRDDRVVLTVQGRLLANEVSLRLRPPPAG
ncbi:MAG: radical SAM family heme chaperone HemW [Actinomycetota bacterium]|nr:radical SAM family heme chaperone HemW [Acidimicrobiia bacterium]MDQ3293753.1 radical SAM family heme chaperone HemW [Actinomycetota bacterium]